MLGLPLFAFVLRDWRFVACLFLWCGMVAFAGDGDRMEKRAEGSIGGTARQHVRVLCCRAFVSSGSSFALVLREGCWFVDTGLGLLSV